ncbi:MAG: hypothetical protein GX207_11575 [Peptococcaceae bacterium]|nr:hypothetical protein [Peptococcaceae bacterium]
MKKRIFLLILALVVLCVTPVQAFAQPVQLLEGISPEWVVITRFFNTCNMSDSGKFEFSSALSAQSHIDKVVIEARLQQEVNGSWKTIKSWISTSSGNTGSLYKAHYVAGGYFYRLVATGCVYHNNKLIEQASYTSPLYWY